MPDELRKFLEYSGPPPWDDVPKVVAEEDIIKLHA